MAPGEMIGRVGLRTAVPVVHAVTNDEVVARDDFIDVACAVLGVLGNRGALHLRANRITGARFQKLAEGLAAAQALTGGWLVINDRVDIALISGARGAQLTSRSLTTTDARRIAPALSIGASVHDLTEGRMAAEAGADWLVAGQVFASQSNAGAPENSKVRVPRFARDDTGGRDDNGEGDDGGGRDDRERTNWISGLASAVSVPVIAIGGIRTSHAELLRSSGVHGVAVIRGIWDAQNAEQAAADYLSAYDDAGVA